MKMHNGTFSEAKMDEESVVRKIRTTVDYKNII